MTIGQTVENRQEQYQRPVNNCREHGNKRPTWRRGLEPRHQLLNDFVKFLPRCHDDRIRSSSRRRQSKEIHPDSTSGTASSPSSPDRNVFSLRQTTAWRIFCGSFLYRLFYVGRNVWTNTFREYPRVIFSVYLGNFHSIYYSTYVEYFHRPKCASNSGKEQSHEHYTVG